MSQKVINVALIGEHKSGKTSLLESLYYLSSDVKSKGSVDNGSSIFDSDPEEIKRKMTIRSKPTSIFWKNTKLNIIDTPGFIDFIGEMEMALEVVENVIIVIDIERGVTVETDRIIHSLDELHVSRAVLVNKTDLNPTSYSDIISQIKTKLGKIAVPFEIPYTENGKFVGNIDIVHRKLVITENKSCIYKDIPPEYESIINKYLEEIFEDISDIDENFMEKYLSGENLTEEEITNGLRNCITKGRIIPIFFVSALNNIGVLNAFDIVTEEFATPDTHKEIVIYENNVEKTINPNTSSTLATVFKVKIDPYIGRCSYIKLWSGNVKTGTELFNASKGTFVKLPHIYTSVGKELIETKEVGAGDIFVVTKVDTLSTQDTLTSENKDIKIKHVSIPSPIYFVSIHPKSKNRADEDKLAELLSRFSEEDPSFIVKFNDFSKELEVHCQGENQLNTYLEILKDRYNIEVELGVPKIPYKETITKTIEAHYKHKKQTGGHGQYGEVFIRVEPLERGKHFEFVDQIRGGHIPKQFIPSVEKGIIEAMEEGVLGYYPVTDVKVTLYEGSFHEVDSSDIAFKIAGWHAMKIALEQGNPTILEPIMEVKIFVYEQHLGAITEDLNSRRGRIQNIDRKEDGTSVVEAFVPMAEMIKYAAVLSSLTKGTGRFTMKLAYYDFLPPKMIQEVAAIGKKVKQSKQQS